MVLRETIFGNWVVKEVILPFLLVFVLVFAILEKTKLLGDNKKQLNAWMAFIIGLIFTTVVYPKNIILDNLILFLTIALVVMLVFMLIYSFASGKGEFDPGEHKWMKWTFGILAGIGIIAILVWSTGYWGDVGDLLFGQSWSSKFWTNILFVIVLVAVLVVALKSDSA